MNLQELNIGISYITFGERNIRDTLIVPALMCASAYKRSVGFFSSSVIDTIMDGIVAIARNQGKIQIIASPLLSQTDVDAISKGYAGRNTVMQQAFFRNIEDAMFSMEDSSLDIFVELIATGIMDIKIIDMEATKTDSGNIGSYHDKLGVIEDRSGNKIVFVGSPNETVNGYQKNYEKVRVFKSWDESQNKYVQDECAEFDALWNNTNPFLTTYDFADALKLHVIKVREQITTDRANKKDGPITLRGYQRQAIEAWKNNNYHGFFVMATGTGKTWTAIYAAKELLQEKSAMLVICAPYKHLVQQWSEDVKRALPYADIVLVSSENHSWDSDLSRVIIKNRLNSKGQIVVISTITSFNLPRFKRAISKSKQQKILIVDEAHRFTNRPESLKNEYAYMLGLSATPFSGKNVEKGKALMAFFGGQVFSLPIEDALERGYLVPYYYNPIVVYASEAEEERFRYLSMKMAACFRNGVCIDPDKLVKHHRNRLRVISMAQEKIDNMDWILSHVHEKDHFIVYCGDGRLFDGSNADGVRHIRFVKDHLDALGFKASQFTAAENISERMDLVDTFNRGEISALAAIRCLDEGINIPSIKGALILSSNDDYREFVQRRGRILRTFGQKKYANIYDVVVLPSIQTPGLAEIELRRFYEYARLALNRDELIPAFEDRVAEYGLDLEEVTNFLGNDAEEAVDE